MTCIRKQATHMLQDNMMCCTTPVFLAQAAHT
jgi:hypothetical protein